MGKAKHGKRQVEAQNAEEVDVVMDMRSVLAMEPEERAKWLSTACRHASEGTVKVNHLYDLLASRKIVTDLADKIGQRMMRTMYKYMWIFSEKQQQYLSQSQLATQFSVDESKASRKEKDPDEAKTFKQKKPMDDAASARMEEMMARCRGFVREKASTYEEREQEAVERQRAALLQQELEVRASEWGQIEAWHAPLEDWEKTQMARQDMRLLLYAREADEARRQAVLRWERESKERDREREEERRQEELRLAEEQRQEELRRAEEAMQEELRRAEKLAEARARWLADEQERRRKEQEVERTEQARAAEERRHAEQRRVAEQKRRSDEQRRAEQLRLEQVRKRQEEERRIAEDRRRADLESQRRVEERQRRHAEEERRAEEDRRRGETERQRAEEERHRKRAEEQRRATDEEVARQRLEEERRHKRGEDERRAGEERQRLVDAQRAVAEASSRAASTSKRKQTEVPCVNLAPSVAPGSQCLKKPRFVFNMVPPPVDGPSASARGKTLQCETSAPSAATAKDAAPSVPTLSTLLSGAMPTAPGSDRIVAGKSALAGDGQQSRQSATSGHESVNIRASQDSTLSTRSEASPDARASPTVGWMAEGAACSLCSKKVGERGGVGCARRRPNGQIVGCGAGVCWRCMNRAKREDFGAVKTTKSEFLSLGEEAWWMHQKCMQPEDEEAYFGAGNAEGEEGTVVVKKSEQPTFAWE